MPGNERVLRVVRGWVEKAESDLKVAALALEAGKDCPTDAVAFHAQQCAEKYIKALLVFNGVDFPKIHDLGELIALLPSGTGISLPMEEERRLTTYATVTRYPGDYEPISLAEARRAIKIAERIREEVRKLLPEEALPQRRK